MNKLVPVPSQPKLPSIYQTQLNKQRNQMDYIANLAIKALGEESSVYRYAVYEAFSTMREIDTLKQTFLINRMTPEMEEKLNNLNMNYLQAMEQIPKDACGRIHQVLQEAATPSNDEGFLGAIIDAFLSFFNS